MSRYYVATAPCVIEYTTAIKTNDGALSHSEVEEICVPEGTLLELASAVIPDNNYSFTAVIVGGEMALQGEPSYYSYEVEQGEDANLLKYLDWCELSKRTTWVNAIPEFSDTPFFKESVREVGIEAFAKMWTTYSKLLALYDRRRQSKSAEYLALTKRIEKSKKEHRNNVKKVLKTQGGS